jgi:hypothetical protein
LILIVWIVQGVDNGKFNKLGELNQPIWSQLNLSM